MWQAVLRGNGVAVLSIYAVQKELQADQLIALQVADLNCDREMFIVWDRRRVLSAPARVPELPRNASHPRHDRIIGAYGQCFAHHQNPVTLSTNLPLR
jgi:DNA-binding transcriptional LysR family regulator